MYVLDSSAIIELLADTEKAKKIEEILGKTPIATTTISYVEVISGVKGKGIVGAIEFFNSVVVLDFDIVAANESIWIEKELKQTGQLLGRTDLFIAGICKQNKFPLVTCDNDFKRVKSITVHVV
jgi:predicted nucleic acid-binding protein